MPGGSTLEHLGAGPGPFALVVRSTANSGVGVGVEARSGLMRSVRSMTLVDDEEARVALPWLGRSFGVSCWPRRIEQSLLRRHAAHMRAQRLSLTSRQIAHAVLRNALSNAVREELVSRNAAKLVKMSNPSTTWALASTRLLPGRC